MSVETMKFEVAGKELDWPLISAAGMTNHPDIDVVASRLEHIAASGVSAVVAGSWTLGEERGGNGYVKTQGGHWEHLDLSDEYVDTENGLGFNAKGLPGPGTDIGMERFSDLFDLAKSHNVELALSLSPHSGEPVEELKELVEVGRKALKLGALYVEFNLSCPNVPDRPQFYLDPDGVKAFHEYLSEKPPLINQQGYLAAFEKYGPFVAGSHLDRLVSVDPPKIYMQATRHLGGIVTSNTLGNQLPKLSDDKPAIDVNGGKAGASGPDLASLGRNQLMGWGRIKGDKELISALGVSNGLEVLKRLNKGANAVQLSSVLYWPELIGCETPYEVVELIKSEFVREAALYP